jgi:heat shock protein HslJ
MNPDDELDARLSAAGKRWRAANPASSAGREPDYAGVAAAAATRNPNRFVVAGSAAAIVVALVGATVWIATRPSHTVVNSTHAGPVVAAPVTALDGPTWLLKTITLYGSTADPASGTTISFDSGKVDGSDGCNHFSGHVTITSTKLSFADVASTAMGCPGGLVPDTEKAVGAALQGSSWRLVGSGKLVLTASDGTTLVYTPALEPTETPADLVGRWQLVQTEHSTTSGDSGAGSSSAAGSGTAGGFDSYLEVKAAGTFTTVERCYTNGGKIVIGHGSATFSDVKITDSTPCPSGVPDADGRAGDSAVDATLSGATNWVIGSDGQLTIRRAGDLLVYRSAPTK